MDAEENQELRELLEEVCDVESGLTVWEVDFIESLCEWEGFFTDPQAAALRKIHARVVG